MPTPRHSPMNGDFVTRSRGNGSPGLGEIDVPGEVGEGDGLANLSGLVEQRLAQLAEAEAAAESCDLLTVRVCVAFGHARTRSAVTSRAIFGSISTMMKRRGAVSGVAAFIFRVAWPVVPDPPKESSTRSPGLDAICNTRSISRMGFGVMKTSADVSNSRMSRSSFLASWVWPTSLMRPKCLRRNPVLHVRRGIASADGMLSPFGPNECGHLCRVRRTSPWPLASTCQAWAGNHASRWAGDGVSGSFVPPASSCRAL